MLTLAQQYGLDDCLRKQNLLTNEDLILELTDHFTLSLNQQMADGVAFETALANVVADFGGRSELQRMERRYNRVTFGRYTEVWKQAALSQLKGHKLLFTMVFFGLIVYLNAVSPTTHKAGYFLSYSGAGVVASLILGVFGVGSKYFESVFRRGWYNPPTGMQYIITRILTGALLLFGTGQTGLLVAEIWPFLLHPAVVATYITSAYVFTVSYGTLYRYLYHRDAPIWIW